MTPYQTNFDFTCFDAPQPANVEHVVPENVDIHVGDVGGQVLNDDFNTDIDEITQMLNQCK